MGTWNLQDSPIFWFTGAPTPTPVSVSCYTSYTLNLTIPDVSNPVDPAVAAAIARGDRRYMRQEGG